MALTGLTANVSHLRKSSYSRRKLSKKKEGLTRRMKLDETGPAPLNAKVKETIHVEEKKNI